jgi:co-chaperonin GroES (HSP10)
MFLVSQSRSSGKRGPMQCKAGDTVVFPKHGAKKFEVEDEEHFIIPEHDILTIIDED